MGGMIRIVSLVCLLVSGLAHPAAAAKRVALVIGNSAYEHATPLENPKNDAIALAAVLERLGFQVVMGVDLTRTAFEKTVRKFSKTLRGADVGLFFYAGHGLQVKGKNYLAPIDASLDDEADLDFETLPVRTILKQMERQTKTNLVILDACRNNPLARNLARSMGTRSVGIGRGLARVATGIGTLIAFATEPGNVALDGEGKNSPFTTALLQHIETPGLDVAQLLRRVRKDVIDVTSGRQVPWNNSSLTGDFFFAGQGAAAAAAPAAPPRAQPPRRNEAAEAWATIQNSNSAAVLNAYLKRYSDGIYADLARARLSEIESEAKQRVAAVAPQEEATRASSGIHTPRPRSAGESCTRRRGDIYCVSSTLAPQGRYSYEVARMMDGSESTAWVEGKKGQGIGEWIVVAYDKPQEPRQIDISNGLGKNKDVYSKNSRVKEIEVRFSNGQTRRFMLADNAREQRLGLGGSPQTMWVQIKILSVYPGWKYQDTAISELRVRAH